MPHSLLPPRLAAEFTWAKPVWLLLCGLTFVISNYFLWFGVQTIADHPNVASESSIARATSAAIGVDTNAVLGASGTSVQTAAIATTYPRIIFVDPSVRDLAPRFNVTASSRVITLGEGDDPLRQMAAALKDVRGLGSIHLYSHGQKGALKINGRVYDRNRLARDYAAELAIIGRALGKNGDILLYGCDLADGVEGRRLVDFLAQATGADIAASSNLTGKGGDWLLEAHNGAIETGPISFGDWQGHLWTAEIYEGAWFGDPFTAPHPNASKDPGGRLSIMGPNQGGAGLTFDVFASVAASSTVQRGQNVAATTYAEAVTNNEYFYSDLVVGGTNGAAISRFVHNQISINNATARMKLAIYDTVTTTLTPISGDILIDGTATLQEPAITRVGMVAGRTYQLRFYYWGCATTCYTDNPRIYTMANQAPTAVNDTFSTSYQTPQSGTLTAANPTTADSDPEAHTLTLDQINGSAITVGTPIALANGTLIITNALNGQFTFTPAQGFTGTQTFTYRINDGFSLTSTATVTINVAASTVVATNDSATRMQSDLAYSNVLNVRTGDTISGAAATSVNSTLSLVSALPSQLTFDTATGNVSVVAGAAAGTYSFTYRICSVANSYDCKTATATVVISPKVSLSKTSAPYSDPVNGTTNPKMIPSGFVAYTITVTNPSSLTVDANTVVISDPTAAQLDLFVNHYTGASGGPVIFTQGSPSSALTYTYTSLASTTDDVEFSNDNGATWTYTPVVGANGADVNVTNIRIRPKGTMAANSSFSVTFRYYIN